MRYTRIPNTAQLVGLIDKALDENGMSASEFHRLAGLSSSYMSVLRSSLRAGHVQNIGSENILAMLDALGLRLVVEDPTQPVEPEAQKPAPASFVEDMRVDQHYGWVPDATGQNVEWGKTIYEIVFKINGEWCRLPVRHVNPEPPKKDK
jgi:hypothetical protein